MENRQITAELNGHKLTFQTDAGVFSKKGIDFGSRLLIESAELLESAHVLDLGCGYGPVGIGLAIHYPMISVKMVDINERAVELAKANAKANQVADRVQVVVSDGFAELFGEQFDVILCNPPIRVGKTFIYQLFQDAYNHLRPSGALWIVIRKQQGAASARKELESIYSSVDLVAQKKGYCIFCAKK